MRWLLCVSPLWALLVEAGGPQAAGRRAQTESDLAGFADSSTDAETKLRNLLLQKYDRRSIPPRLGKSSPVDVQFAINIYKIHSLDLPSSMLTLLVWMRETWTDTRLKFNASDFPPLGDIMEHPYVRVFGDDIWVPDITLYNHEESVHTTLADEGIMVYEDGSVFRSRPGLMKVLCKFGGLRDFPWDKLHCTLEFGAWVTDGTLQNISLRRADCGYTWWGGTGCEGETGTTGSEAGMSFQEYSIRQVSVERKTIYFDCCKNTPWPTLLYTIALQRAMSYYRIKLVIPLVVLTYASFFPMWMSPETGERLGFAITIILAIIAADIVAAELLPICEETLWMSALTVVSFGYSIAALAESCLALYLHHCRAMSWWGLLPELFWKRRYMKMMHQILRMPGFMGHSNSDGSGGRAGREHGTSSSSSGGTAKRLSELRRLSTTFRLSGSEVGRSLSDSAISSPSSRLGRPSTGASHVSVIPGEVVSPRSSESHEEIRSPRQKPIIRMKTTDSMIARLASSAESVQAFRLRSQLYRQAFNVLDSNRSGTVTSAEIELFGVWMLGDDWSSDLCEQFRQSIKFHDATDASFTEEEFIDFCESVLVRRAVEEPDDSAAVQEYIGPMVQGFLQMVALQDSQIVAMWKARASTLDTWARWILVGSYTVVCFVFSQTSFETGAK